MASLVLAHDEPAYFESPPQFGAWVNQISRDIIGGTAYNGVRITVTDKTIDVFDGSTPPTAKQIDSSDMIGQPTWLGLLTIQVIFVMRFDLKVGDRIRMPPAAFTTTGQSYSQYRDNSIQVGVFTIRDIRHVGNFRQPNGLAWITVVNAYSDGTA